MAFIPPNAWFLYVAPLVIACIFLVGGVKLFRQAFRGDHDQTSRRYGARGGCGGLLLALIGATVALALILTSPPPWQRQRLFDHVLHTAPERIERFIILPAEANQYRPLTQHEVVIADRQTIQRISDSLNAATEIWPNHPQTKWSAHIEMITRDGTFYFGVDAPNPGDKNGTLVRIAAKKDGRWNLGDVRADRLDQILEDAVQAAEKR